jgi:hypothetical protein
MTLAIRFLPNPGRKVIYGAGGQAYPSTGATVDIPFPDAETIQSDQATRLMIEPELSHQQAGCLIEQAMRWFDFLDHAVIRGKKRGP